LDTRNETASAQAHALQALVGSSTEGKFVRRRLPWIFAAFVIVAAVLLWLRSGKDDAEPRYKTEAASMATLIVKVSATGNLQPTNQVEVGSELSGIVEQVFVDENDRVAKGQELARLDVAKLQDMVSRSRAALAAAEAQVLQAQASVIEKQAALSRFQRMSEMTNGTIPSRSEMDTAVANAKRAEADVASAHAGVSQARAALRSDETNLYKASIRSPIDGIVLTRKVEPGQTVAASFQAPVLFTIAEDLAQMELQVDVDEADVGQVQIGQQASFTVDAWPGRKYAARITRVGFGSQEKDGVISYLTVLEVGNDDLSLRPGMTGTAEITTLVRENALLVPNAALRFSPPKAGTPEKKSGGSVVGALMPRPPVLARKQRYQPGEGPQRVWVLRDGKPAAIEVKAGATNGKVTEILGGELEAGMEVITESVTKSQ
jgi:HlyD family secretion protein